MLGDNFNDNLNDANILAAVEQARNRDIRSILRTNGTIESRPDIPLLELQYQDQVNLYGNIKNQRTEAEDNLRTVERQTRILMRDVEMFKDEVCNAGSSDLSPSVLKDFLDQLADMKKRLINIRSMDDHEPPVVPIVFHGAKDTQQHTVGREVWVDIPDVFWEWVEIMWVKRASLSVLK